MAMHEMRALLPQGEVLAGVAYGLKFGILLCGGKLRVIFLSSNDPNSIVLNRMAAETTKSVGLYEVIDVPY